LFWSSTVDYGPASHGSPATHQRGVCRIYLFPTCCNLVIVPSGGIEHLWYTYLGCDSKVAMLCLRALAQGTNDLEQESLSATDLDRKIGLHSPVSGVHPLSRTYTFPEGRSGGLGCWDIQSWDSRHGSVPSPDPEALRARRFGDSEVRDQGTKGESTR